MTGQAMQETVRAKIDGKLRLSREEGRWLLTEAPLLDPRAVTVGPDGRTIFAAADMPFTA